MLEVSRDGRAAIVAKAREVQERKGWTNAEVGMRLGCSESAWTHILNGRRQPGVRLLRAIPRVFPETSDLVVRLFFGT